MSELYIDTERTIRDKFKLVKDAQNSFNMTWNCNFFYKNMAKWNFSQPLESLLLNPKFKVNLSVSVIIDAYEGCPCNISEYVGDKLKVRDYPISNITNHLIITLNNQALTSLPLENVNLLNDSDEAFNSPFVTKSDDKKEWKFDVTLTESFDLFQELFKDDPQQMIPNIKNWDITFHFIDKISKIFYIDNFNGSFEHTDVTDQCKLPFLKDISVRLNNATLIFDVYKLPPYYDIIYPYVKHYKDHTIISSHNDKYLLPGESTKINSLSIQFYKKPSNIIVFVNDQSLIKNKSVVLSDKNIKIHDYSFCLGRRYGTGVCPSHPNNLLELKHLTDKYDDVNNDYFFNITVECTNTNNYPMKPSVYVYYEYDNKYYIFSDGNVNIEQ